MPCCRRRHWWIWNEISDWKVLFLPSSRQLLGVALTTYNFSTAWMGCSDLRLGWTPVASATSSATMSPARDVSLPRPWYPETARNQNRRSGDHPNENKHVKNKRTCTSWRDDEGHAARGGDQQTSHRRWRCPPRFCRRRRAGERRMAGTHLIYAVSFHDPINMG